MDDRSRGRRRARWTTRAMLAASVVGTAWLSVVSLTGQESNSSPKADASTFRLIAKRRPVHPAFGWTTSIARAA